MDDKIEVVIEVEELESRIAPSHGNFPPGQRPSGNPAHAPGSSMPILIAGEYGVRRVVGCRYIVQTAVEGA